MQLEARKYLFDIQRALGALQEFLGEKGFRSISRIQHLFACCCPRLTGADTCVQRSLPRTDRR